MTESSPPPCPTCKGEGCDRCYQTGRMFLIRVVTNRTAKGRGDVTIWYGAPGSMYVVAQTPKGKDLPDVAIDGFLEAIQADAVILYETRDAADDTYGETKDEEE